MSVEIRENFDAKNLTSFKVSGSIERAYFPKNIEELTEVLKTTENPIVLGNCSNVLLSSSGIKGDVIFTQKCSAIEINSRKVYAECGLKGPMASNEVLKHSLSGFEFMIGFPGSIGGEVYMNASAKEQAISDCLTSAQVFDLDSKKAITLSKNELEFGYRSSICQRKNYIVLSAEFELEEKNKDEIKNGVSINSATAITTDNATVSPIKTASDLLSFSFAFSASSSSSKKLAEYVSVDIPSTRESINDSTPLIIGIFFICHLAFRPIY